jgi:NAD(P)-dependent dehydrogenase (short-subunit alcohol dehydrogenase family)
MSELPRRLVDGALEATVVLSFSKTGYLARRRLWDWQPLPRLDGKRVLVTGPTSGLGRATAHRLAELGASVHLVGRNPARTEATREQLERSTGNRSLTVGIADLSDFDQVRELADRFLAENDRLDALVHNAGALLDRYEEGPSGHEVTVAAHVLGPFLLTTRLLPLLEATPGSRVVTVSSGGMYTERLSVADLELSPDAYRGSTAYARAKRAQVELNEQWAARHPVGPPSFLAMHPGWAATPGVEASLPLFNRVLGPLLRSPEQGADTIAWLVASDEPVGQSGAFWMDRRRRATVHLPWTNAGEDEASRLWDWVTAQVGAPDLPPPA